MAYAPDFKRITVRLVENQIFPHDETADADCNIVSFSAKQWETG
jgi:hypothetical protein